MLSACSAFQIFYYLFIYFNKFIYLFIFGCIGSSLLHTGFLQSRRAGATLHCSARASHCSGFSCCGARALDMWVSVVVACGLSSYGSQTLEQRLSSCGAQAQLFRGMWDLPGPRLEAVSPALAGGFLTTAPPGKSPRYFMIEFLNVKNISFWSLKLFSEHSRKRCHVIFSTGLKYCTVCGKSKMYSAPRLSITYISTCQSYRQYHYI